MKTSMRRHAPGFEPGAVRRSAPRDIQRPAPQAISWLAPRAAPWLAAGLILGLGACGDNAEPAWRDEGAYRWRPLEFSRRGDPGFTSMPARRTGVDFQNRVTTEQSRQNEHLLAGSGVALGDVDGDGRVDIYLARHDGPNALYRNLGGWEFEEVAAEAGVSAPDRFSTGAALADVDGDGDPDLLVTALGGPNALYLNDSSGRFTEATEAAGLSSDRGSTTMALADVDADGDLDLYVANYKKVSAEDLIPPWERSYEKIVRETDEGPVVAPELREHYRIVEISERDIVAYAQRAEPDWLYLNDGAGRFEAVEWTANRFLDEQGEPLAEAPDLFGLAARFYDVDRDGDPDLYVCNDFEDPDLFFVNDGAGRFRKVRRAAVRATSNACMAVDFADVDRDGDVDWFELDMRSRDPLLLRTQMPSHTALAALPGEIEDRPQMQRNTLFLNRGDLTFAQAAEYAGVDASGWSWSTLFLDVDLDGYEDLLVGNGHELNVQDLDADLLARRTGQAIAAGRRDMDWRDLRFLYPDLHTGNVAFRNRGDWTFEEVGEVWGFDLGPDVSHGMAAGDLDGDGDADVVINRLGAPVALLRNDAPGRRVAVRLAGEPPNTAGVGAKVRLLGGAVPVQEREVTLGGLYLSSSDPQLAFAAGDAEELTIEVQWPSGARSVVHDARPDRLYEVREVAATGDASPAPGHRAEGGTEPAAGAEGGGSGPSADAELLPGFDAPWDGRLFEDRSADLGHVHVETPFDDFARQPLLPNRLSQLGPGITWYDLDGDSDEDLVIPPGRGGRAVVFRNEGGRLVRAAGEAPEADGDWTTVLGWPAGRPATDPGSPAAASLLIGVASYEAGSPAEAEAAPAVLRLDAGTLIGERGARPGAGARVAEPAEVVPGIRASTGPLAQADYDGDGDLDLFVGGRVVPGVYPAPATSRLFRNEGGRLVLDEGNAAALESVGLVSAAVFSDVDGDGDPDLLLALDWGPIGLLRNDDGRLVRADVEGLTERPGRWNGITTGDLDADGRPDVVATSWGRNTVYRPEPGRPLRLLYGDFDGNRSVDVLLAQLEDRGEGRALYPLEHPMRLVRALPGGGRGLESYVAWAAASAEQLIGGPPEEAFQVRTETYEHTLFLNRGDRFEPVALPPEAQLAPAFYAGVADFDGDGNEDLFLSQNFFPTPTEEPRYDAGRGLLLLGDGAGGLEPVPGQTSGIEVYGDSRGAAFADYDADGRVDLAVSQNGAATKLYRNVAARPGLRVRLEGPPGNPHGVGAVVRLVYSDRLGPSREVHAGSGYWSQDGAVQVLGNPGEATAVHVRWPGGFETRTPVASGAREVRILDPAGNGGY